MKFIRKIAELVISVILLASIVIALGVVFAVRNVNVTLMSYSCEADSDGAKEKIAEFKREILSDCRGTVIAFVSEKDVAAVVDDGAYVVESFEKVYPCTLNVTLRERKEVFVSVNGEGSFNVYDEDGVFLRKAATETEAYNSIDGAPNLYVSGAETEEDFKFIASACKSFKERFISLRSVTAKVELQKAKSQFDSDRIVFYLRCGVSMEIQDCRALTAEKIGAGYLKYGELTGEQKLKGKIYCYVTPESKATATYNANA